MAGKFLALFEHGPICFLSSCVEERGQMTPLLGCATGCLPRSLYQLIGCLPVARLSRSWSAGPEPGPRGGGVPVRGSALCHQLAVLPAPWRSMADSHES